MKKGWLNSGKRKFLSILLSVAMVAVMLPANVVDAHAETETCSDCNGTGNTFKCSNGENHNDEIDSNGSCSVCGHTEVLVTCEKCGGSGSVEKADSDPNGGNTDPQNSQPQGSNNEENQDTEPASHNHNFAEGWSYDNTYHWHACNGEGASDSCLSEEGAAKAEHSLDPETGKCSVCDYQQSDQQCDQHTWDAATGKCSMCDAECNHSWDEENGTCSICGFACSHSWNEETGKCSVCGIGCTHSWDEETGKCTVCGIGCTHSWDEETGKCTVCGKTKTEEDLDEESYPSLTEEAYYIYYSDETTEDARLLTLEELKEELEHYNLLEEDFEISEETVLIEGKEYHYIKVNKSHEDLEKLLAPKMFMMALGIAPHLHCVCGKSSCSEHGGSVTWTAWDGTGDGEVGESLPSEGGSYYLTRDITITDTWVVGTDTKLCLNGHSITLNKDSDGYNPVIYINNGVTFTLTDCCETYGNITHADGCKGIGINNIGTFNQYGGNICNNTVSGNGMDGCGVLNGTNIVRATYNLYNGIIKNNKSTGTNSNDGGGVASWGTFNMYGGEICSNESYTSGGGMITYTGGTTNISGGTIHDNKSGMGGGLCIQAGGEATMSGGEIYENTINGLGGAGVGNQGTFILNNGKIYKNTAKPGSGMNIGVGGGVGSTGTFTMYGGEIYENKSEGAGGGGVVNVSMDSACSFTMSGGSIYNNTVTASANGLGGGVLNLDYGHGATFILSEDGSISNNSAALGAGVGNCYGTLNIEGGSITKNTATSTGGGVFNELGIVSITGGSITGNKAGENGGGIFYAGIDGYSGMALGGNVSIVCNTLNSGAKDNLCFCNGEFMGEECTTPLITISAPLTNTTPIGISVNEAPTEDTPVQVVNSGTADYSSKFKSDNSSYSIKKTTESGNTIICLAYGAEPEPSPTPSPEQPKEESSESTESTETPSAPQTNVPVTEKVSVDVTGKNTLGVDAVINKGEAKVGEITPGVINSALNNDKNVSTIKIDVTKAKQDVSSVEISPNSLAMLNYTLADTTNNVETITVDTKSASVEIDKATFYSLTQMAGGNSLKVVVEKTEQKKQLNSLQQAALSDKIVAKTFEVYFTSNGTRLAEVKDGKVKVTVKMTVPEGVNKNFYHVYYLDEKGKMTLYATKSTDLGLEFTADHFADYGVIYDPAITNAGVTDNVYTSANEYEIKSKDTLWAIAKKNKISLKDLLALNPDLGDGQNIKVGDKIRLK